MDSGTAGGRGLATRRNPVRTVIVGWRAFTRLNGIAGVHVRLEFGEEMQRAAETVSTD